MLGYVGRRGWVARALAIAVLATAGLVGAPASSWAYETEPNDTQATATRLPWGTIFDAPPSMISPAGDVDWYRVEADSVGVWTALARDVSTDLSSGLTLRAFDSHGREIGRRVAGSATVLTAVEAPMESTGYVYFSVTATNPAQVGSYQLEVWPQFGRGTPWTSQREPNGSPFLSNELPIGEEFVNGLYVPAPPGVQVSADVDMYHVTGGAKDEVYSVQLMSRDTDYKAQVLDEDLHEVSSAACQPWRICNVTIDVAAGTLMFLKVSAPSADTRGAFGGCALRAGQQWCTGEWARVTRVAGTDRYSTAAAWMDHELGPDGSAMAIYIASGEVFPDALSGAAAASAGGFWLLPVKQDEIPAVIDRALRRRTVPKIVILGGPATISPAVERALAGYGANSVERWAGKDRYETSAVISRNQFRPGVNTAYIASGEVFADALAAGPAPEVSAGPVLLTRPDRLPDAIAEELTRLRPDRIVVVGGEASIAPAVEAALAHYTTGAVERWAGKDRYATAAEVSAHQPTTVQHLVVASGEVFTDALTAAPAARNRRGPILLLTKDRIPASTAAELRRLKPYTITILGGVNSVSDAVRRELANYAAQ